MTAPRLTDKQICDTISLIADSIPESDFINRMRLNVLLGEISAMQGDIEALHLELSKRPRMVLLAGGVK